jgi:uncharacterized protein (TIGR00645 family)
VLTSRSGWTPPCGALVAVKAYLTLLFTQGDKLMNRIARAIEMVVLHGRWLVTPFLLGLIVGLGALLYTFVIKLVSFLTQIQRISEEEVIVGILKLVDLSLTANLLLIVVCSSYENFVARIDPASQIRWPEGLIGIGFSGMKQKLLGSIVAIAAVNVLEWFIDIDRSVDNTKLGWAVGILLAFATVMLVLAFADRLDETQRKKSRNPRASEITEE